MKKAIFFDLFDTLITEYDPNWKPKQDFSPELTCDLFDKHWSVRRKRMELNKEYNYRSVMNEILREINIKLDSEIIEYHYNEYLQEKRELYKRISIDFKKTIDALKNMGYKIGLISNLSKDDFEGWNECILANSFDSVTLSFEIGIMKPELKIFEVACESLNLKPEQCIYIGDGGSGELTAAKSLGMESYYASWFIEKWPIWKKKESGRDIVENFQRLEDIKEVISIAKMV